MHLFALGSALLVVASGHTAAATTARQTLNEEQPYQVTIAFLGLMTWDLPDVTPKVATVIIPDVTDGADDIGDDKHDVHEHVAYILSDTKTMPRNHRLNKTNRFEPADEDGPDGLKYRYLPLSGESISIDDENEIVNSKPLEYVNKGCRGNPCPTKDNETALCWLSSMREVHDGVAQPKDLDDHFNRLPQRTTIAGRMVVRHGDLKARVIHNTATKKAPVWDFATPVGLDHANDIKLTQALAQEVHWTFEARGVPFVLNLLSFDGTSRRVAFMPQDGRINIVIGNTAPKDTGPVANPVTADRDEHYSIYHRFIKDNKHGLGRIPFRAKTECTSYTFAPFLVPRNGLTKTASSHSAHDTSFKKTSAYTGTVAATSTQPSPGGLNCAANQFP